MSLGLRADTLFGQGAAGGEFTPSAAPLAPFISETMPAAAASTDTVSPSEHVEPTSELLAERAKAGCFDSFERLVARFEARVFNFLRQFTGNHHDAEDLTQETFVKAYRGLARFDSKFSFATWIFTIARRTAASHFRSARLFEELPADEESIEETPATALESKDERKSIWRLVSALQPKQSEALWWRYEQGFSVAEVARIMGTNQIHIKVLLHRARGSLLKALTAPGVDVVEGAGLRAGKILEQQNARRNKGPL